MSASVSFYELVWLLSISCGMCVSNIKPTSWQQWPLYSQQQWPLYSQTRGGSTGSNIRKQTGRLWSHWLMVFIRLAVVSLNYPWFLSKM